MHQEAMAKYEAALNAYNNADNNPDAPGTSAGAARPPPPPPPPAPVTADDVDSGEEEECAPGHSLSHGLGLGALLTNTGAGFTCTELHEMEKGLKRRIVRWRAQAVVAWELGKTTLLDDDDNDENTPPIARVLVKPPPAKPATAEIPNVMVSPPKPTRQLLFPKKDFLRAGIWEEQNSYLGYVDRKRLASGGGVSRKLAATPTKEQLEKHRQESEQKRVADQRRRLQERLAKFGDNPGGSTTNNEGK